MLDRYQYVYKLFNPCYDRVCVQVSSLVRYEVGTQLRDRVWVQALDAISIKVQEDKL